MTHYFDGNKYSKVILEKLHKKVKLNNKQPVLVSILIGDNPASHLYVNLKKKVGESIGVKVEIIKYNNQIKVEEVFDQIKKLNSNKSIDGIMIQMPIPENLKPNTKDLINIIDPKKDVDGLRENSVFLHPTAMAVIKILKHALRMPFKDQPLKVCLIGYSGMVGKPLIKELGIRNKELWGKGLEIIKCDIKTKNIKQKIKNADVVISATGKAGLIKADMIKKNCILIDVGSPKGDIEKNAYERAMFVSPVPGGVGPVTVACLFQNLIDKSPISM